MVSFYLATPKRKRSAVYMSITFDGRQFRRTTKVSTLVKFWNPQKQRVRVCRENPAGNRNNDLLEQWCSAATKAILQFRGTSVAPSAQTVFEAVDHFFYAEEGVFPMQPRASSANEAENESVYFTKYFEGYLERYKCVRSQITINHYRTVLRKLYAFERQTRKRLRFEDIDIAFYNKFKPWVYGQGYSDNYFGSLIKIIKQVYREAREVDHLHALNGTAHKGFITVMKESDPIFLTVNELMRLHRLELTKQLIQEEWPTLLTDKEIQRRIETCDLVRNRFLIGAFSGLRVSDFSRLADTDITDDGLILLRTRKTDTPVAIPVHPVIQEILNSGFRLDKTISDQKMNIYIKRLAKMAGIDSRVVIREHRAGTVVEKCMEKYKLISTHTARRSFATNLLKAKDVPLAAISKALGHSKITTTMRYLRVGVEENADILAASSFFKDLSR